MVTSIEVERAAGRHAARLTHGLLRPQVVASGADRCRIGLLATTALLLGGDVVDLEVWVGAGARLDLFDVAGTVAYHGRGEPSAWRVRAELADGAGLTYAGEPFVVADGADVSRTLDLDLGQGAGAVLRDTLVLGRSGQVGGRVRTATTVRRAGSPVLLEDQRLDPDHLRDAPGMLGPCRVLDTVTWLGATPPPVPGVTTYALEGGAGTVARWLGTSLARSPLHRVDVGRAQLVPRPPAVPSGPEPAAQSTASSR